MRRTRTLRSFRRGVRRGASFAGRTSASAIGAVATAHPKRYRTRWKADAPLGSLPGDGPDRRRRPHAAVGAPRVAVAGPVHRALHDVAAASAHVAVRPAREGIQRGADLAYVHRGRTAGDRARSP